MSAISDSQFGNPRSLGSIGQRGEVSGPASLSSQMPDSDTGKSFPEQPHVSRLVAHMRETLGSVGGDTAWVSDPRKVQNITKEAIGSTLMAGIGNQ